MRVVVLISGTGSNCQAIIQYSQQVCAHYQVVGVLSNRTEAAGLSCAAQYGIECRSLNPADYGRRTEFDQALLERIDSYRPELVVLAGFMRILSPFFVQHFAGRLINIHPSLLPKYPGLHTHQRALDAGDKIHGASIHFVTEELDGGPVIAQSSTPIFSTDNEHTLAAKVLCLEHKMYPEIVELFAQKRLKQVGNRVSLDEILISPIQYS